MKENRCERIKETEKEKWKGSKKKEYIKVLLSIHSNALEYEMKNLF